MIRIPGTEFPIAFTRLKKFKRNNPREKTLSCILGRFQGCVLNGESENGENESHMFNTEEKDEDRHSR